MTPVTSTARGGARTALDARAAALAVGTRPDECDCVTGDAPAAEGVCSTAAMLERLADFIGPAEPATSATELVNSAAAQLGCTAGGAALEGCVVTHPAVLEHIRATEGPSAAAAHQAQARRQLKTAGPRHGNQLLSNFNIDEVLARWALEFGGFFNCPFAMFDFDRVPGYRFGEVDLAKVRAGRETQEVFNPAPRGAADGFVKTRRPCDTFACVLNTDVSDGKGKHWVCVFVDMRGLPAATPDDTPTVMPGDTPVAAPDDTSAVVSDDTPVAAADDTSAATQPVTSQHPPQRGATIEYFNSSGRPPPRQVIQWMERQADFLKRSGAVDTVVVTSLAHQRSKTECGLYALYYIRSRLEGRPWRAFRSARVPDKDMEAFRQHVFSGAK